MNPNEIHTATTDVLRVWTANPDFKMKDVTLAGLQADADTLRSLMADIADRDAEITRLRNDRDALTLKLHSAGIRARAGFKSYFGEDSNEYELAGGTRTSERKRPGPRPTKVELKAA